MIFYGCQVVKALLVAMDDYANPRVQSHAGAALVNFSEECPKHILTLYLDAIIEKLEQVLSATFQQVCVTAHQNCVQEGVSVFCMIVF